jgi:hypothetical protein
MLTARQVWFPPAALASATGQSKWTVVPLRRSLSVTAQYRLDARSELDGAL